MGIFNDAKLTSSDIIIYDLQLLSNFKSILLKRLNIFTNGTSILNPGTFSYNFYPNVPVSFTASFTGKSDSAIITGSLDFFFNGFKL